MDGRINHHRLFPRRGSGNLLIHIEEVTIPLGNPLVTQTLDGVGEVQEHGQTRLVHAIAGVATLLGGTRSHITRNQVTEGRIAALQIVIPILFRNLGSFDGMFAEFLHIFQFLGNPDTAVVTQRFAHQGQFALLLAMYRNTGRVNLGKAGIGEESTFLIALPGGGAIGIHCIRGEEIGVSITAGSNHHGMGAKALQLTRYEVTGDDTLCLTVYQHQIQHLVTRIALHGTGGNLTIQGGIGTQQQLLSGLSAGIEGTAHLNTAERTVGQVSAVFTGKRNSLCYALVDNRRTHLCQTVNVGFTGTIVTAFDGVVEKTINGVIVVLVILGSVDTTLRGNRMCTARRVADTEYLHIVTELAQGSGCRRSAQTGTHYNDLQFPFVVGTDKMNLGFTLGPFFGKRSVRNLGN